MRPEHLRTQLHAMRKAKGLTQRDVAKAIGVTQATVSRLESGARAPDPVIVRAYIKAVEGSLTCPVCGEVPPCARDDMGRPLLHAT